MKDPNAETEKQEWRQEKKQRVWRERLKRAVSELRNAGLTDDEIREAFDQIIASRKP